MQVVAGERSGRAKVGRKLGRKGGIGTTIMWARRSIPAEDGGELDAAMVTLGVDEVVVVGKFGEAIGLEAVVGALDDGDGGGELAGAVGGEGARFKGRFDGVVAGGGNDEAGAFGKGARVLAPAQVFPVTAMRAGSLMMTRPVKGNWSLGWRSLRTMRAAKTAAATKKTTITRDRHSARFVMRCCLPPSP